MATADAWLPGLGPLSRSQARKSPSAAHTQAEARLPPPPVSRNGFRPGARTLSDPCFRRTVGSKRPPGICCRHQVVTRPLSKESPPPFQKQGVPPPPSMGGNGPLCPSLSSVTLPKVSPQPLPAQSKALASQSAGLSPSPASRHQPHEQLSCVGGDSWGNEGHVCTQPLHCPPPRAGTAAIRQTLPPPPARGRQELWALPKAQSVQKGACKFNHEGS